MPPVPKSLHTVTVLITMAKLIQETRPHYTKEDAVYKALETLGYTSTADHYGLALQALKKLNKVTQ